MTNQKIAKYWNSHMNGNLTTRGFQRDQNYQISPCILKVIAPANQCPNWDWKSTVDGQMLNWGLKWWWNFIIITLYPVKADETRNPMKQKSSDLDLRSERNPCLKINKNS